MKRKNVYQEKEAGTGQPEVPPAVTVDVEVFGWEMFIWVTDLQSSLTEQQMLY